MLINKERELKQTVYTEFKTSYGSDLGLEKTSGLKQGFLISSLFFLSQLLLRFKPIQHPLKVGMLGSTEAVIYYGIYVIMSNLNAATLTIEIVKLALATLLFISLANLVIESIFEFVSNLQQNLLKLRGDFNNRK